MTETGVVYVTPVFDCAHCANPKQENLVRLAVAFSSKNGESTALGRAFKSFDDLRKELMRTKLLGAIDLNSLDQSFWNTQSWYLPNPIAVTNEQATQLKLRPIRSVGIIPASH